MKLTIKEKRELKLINDITHRCIDLLISANHIVTKQFKDHNTSHIRVKLQVQSSGDWAGVKKSIERIAKKINKEFGERMYSKAEYHEGGNIYVYQSIVFRV